MKAEDKMRVQHYQHKENVMTKADEKALLAEMIEHCPDGYVKDILSDMQPEIERAITSDFGWVPVADRMRDLEEYRQAIENNKATVKTLGYKIEELGRQTAVLENALRSLRTDAQRLARL
jgi:hypothetical protein